MVFMQDVCQDRDCTALLSSWSSHNTACFFDIFRFKKNMHSFSCWTTRRIVFQAEGVATLCRFLSFHEGAASFPWLSQARWIADRLHKTHGGKVLSEDDLRSVVRPDLHRQHLSAAGFDLPGASAKLEGSILEPTAVASAAGQIVLQPDRFFDGQIFDPYR